MNPTYLLLTHMPHPFMVASEKKVGANAFRQVGILTKSDISKHNGSLLISDEQTGSKPVAALV
jgi:hypothetical protein